MADPPARQKKSSPVGKIFDRLSSRIRRTNVEKQTTVTGKGHSSNLNSSVKSSTESPFRKTISRISFSRKHKIDKIQDPVVPVDAEDDEATTAIDESRWVKSSPRPALSESDLRFITIRRDREVPITPLAGAQPFLSEDNLAAADCGAPLENRVPSYMKISYTLNGYRSPRAAGENTPIRPAGKSLIERRLAQLRGAPQQPSSDSCHSPVASSPMGSTCSSPSVKNLIGQFDRLKLCLDLDDSEHKENVKPTPVISQPGTTAVEDKPIVTAICDATASTSSEPVESASMSEGSTVAESATSSARSGSNFQEILSSTRKSLEERSKQANSDLEHVPNMPEQAADSIRMASGKATLLIRKKLAKFEELVNANLNPETSEKLTTTEDLEGYWALVEMELCDINNCFSEVDKWRSRLYAESPTDSSSPANGEANNNEVKKPRVLPKPAVAPKPVTEKQKAAAEQRKKMIAEARARLQKTAGDGTSTVLV